MRVLQDPPLSFVPSRAPLQSASLGPVALYLGAFLLVCLVSGDPIVLLSAALGASIAGIGAGCTRAVLFSLKLGGAVALLMVGINGLVAERGANVLLRLGEWPLLGQVDITAEALAAGAVIGLRALGTMVVIGVWSAAVDPDRVLASVHRVARRSALTATLVSRLVPLAVADQVRLAEASRLRGPAATPVGRAATARRLLAGSLDRSVDVAATLELRGYSTGGRASAPAGRRSRHDRRFFLGGLAIIAALALSAISGDSGFTAYPSIEWHIGPATILLSALLVGAGLLTRRGPGGDRGR